MRGSSRSHSLLWQWSVSRLPRLAGKSCPLRCPKVLNGLCSLPSNTTYHSEAIRILPSRSSLLSFNIKQNTFDYLMPSLLPGNKSKKFTRLAQSTVLPFIVYSLAETRKQTSLSKQEKSHRKEKSVKIRQAITAKSKKSSILQKGTFKLKIKGK